MILYRTPSGVIVPSVGKKQMIEIDRIAVEETGPNLFQMMENAGRNLAELTFNILRDLKTNQKIIVLTGTGSNGGGGMCAARHLANRGYDVSVCITKIDKPKNVPAYQLKILKSTITKIISIEDLKNERPDLIIDAIIGYSLKGKPKGVALELIEWAECQLGIKISLDIPSGIDADSGERLGSYVKPDLTLTLALPKTGLLPELTGELFLGDIGIPEKVFRKMGIDYVLPFNKSYIVQLNPG